MNLQFNENELHPSIWRKFCEYLGICPKVFFRHQWKFHENQHQRTCQKCYLKQRYNNGDLWPFDGEWQKD